MSNTDRRSFLAGLLVSSGSLLSGCLSPSGDTADPTETPSPDTTASPPPASQTSSGTTTQQDGRTAAGGLKIRNYTPEAQEVSITIVEAPESSPDYEHPGTLTAETPVNTTTPLFQRDVLVGADISRGVSDVFPKPDGPVTYHVFAQIEDNNTATYRFENFPGSGFGYLDITIHSEADLEIAHAVV